MLYRYKNITFFFGDVTTSFIPSDYRAGTEIHKQAPFIQPAQLMQLKHLLFLHQVHGNEGYTITDPRQAALLPAFTHDGDFLVTSLVRVGLGIVTADCLPLILYDTNHHAVAMTHAGWRGSVQRVALKTLQTLTAQYATDPQHVVVFFGPCAHVCCYQIQSDIVPLLYTNPYALQCIQTRQEQLFFDIIRYNTLQLSEAGVPVHSFFSTYSTCTMESSRYCSFRTTQSAQRNMSIVAVTS